MGYDNFVPTKTIMKILFCSITYGKNIFAGMENAAFNFVHGLRESGHNVFVFTSNAYIKSGKQNGIVVKTSDYLPHDFPTTDGDILRIYKKNKIKISIELKEFIRETLPDLIISWDPLWGIVQYVDKKALCGIKTAVVFHVVSALPILKRANTYNYDFYFAVSTNLALQIKPNVTKKINILPNSINFRLYKPWLLPKKKPYITINGRLSPEKGINYAVQGAIPFLKRNQNYKLILFSGDFPFGDKNIVKSEILSILTRHNLENRIIWKNNIEWRKIPKILMQSSIVILPSLFESFGIAALETMASGTLLICTNVGNLPNLVQDTAIIVRPKSIKSIEKALLSLTSKDIHNKPRAKKSRHIAQMYDRKRIADGFIKQIKAKI